MGEVYRAHDDTLGREVAIKVLPAEFMADPKRRARFEREARMLATLNHPHIGAIYGVEEADGVRGLVLELIEGETLAQRIAVLAETTINAETADSSGQAAACSELAEPRVPRVLRWPSCGYRTRSSVSTRVSASFPARIDPGPGPNSSTPLSMRKNRFCSVPT